MIRLFTEPYIVSGTHQVDLYCDDCGQMYCVDHDTDDHVHQANLIDRAVDFCTAIHHVDDKNCQ